MDKTDKILKISLQAILSRTKQTDLVDCEKDLKEWTSYEFVQVTARLLNSLISDDNDKIDTKGFKETSMAEKYRICIGLSEKLKQHGYTEDVTFSNFFYPSPMEIRKIIQWLIKQQPEGGSEGGKGSKPLLHRKDYADAFHLNDNSKSGPELPGFSNSAEGIDQLKIFVQELRKRMETNKDKHDRVTEEDLIKLEQEVQTNRNLLKKCIEELEDVKAKYNESEISLRKQKHLLELTNDSSPEKIQERVARLERDYVKLQEAWLEYKEPFEREIKRLEKSTETRRLEAKFMKLKMKEESALILKYTEELRSKREYLNSLTEWAKTKPKGISANRMDFLEKVYDIVEALNNQEKELQKVKHDILLLNKENESLEGSNMRLFQSISAELRSKGKSVHVQALDKIQTLRNNFRRLNELTQESSKLQIERRQLDDNITVLVSEEHIEERLAQLMADMERLK